jgi:hypothetical protein
MQMYGTYLIHRIEKKFQSRQKKRNGEHVHLDGVAKERKKKINSIQF